MPKTEIDYSKLLLNCCRLMPYSINRKYFQEKTRKNYAAKLKIIFLVLRAFQSQGKILRVFSGFKTAFSKNGHL